MTRWPAAREAAIYAREHPKLSVGLHLDLGEWVCRSGKWTQLYSVISLDDKSAVERGLLNNSMSLRVNGQASHSCELSSTLHMREPVRSVTLQICQSLGIPLRDLSPEIHYFTKFYGQTPDASPIPSYISLDRMIEIISTLPTGLTVITCHPGYADDLETMYQTERRDELGVRRDPRVRAAIDELAINLCSSMIGRISRIR